MWPMSSACSPSIEFDCRPQLAARIVVVAAVCTAAITTLLVERSPWTVAVLLTGVSAAIAGCAATGWFGGPKTLSRATWTSEGTWWLTDRRGEALQAMLLADSRVFGHWLWLRWDSAQGRRQAFLIRRSVQSE